MTAVPLPRLAIEVVHKGVRIHPLVVNKPQSRTMNLVRARLHHEVEDAATRAAVFRTHSRRLNFEFFERFHGRAGLAELAADVDGGVGTIEHDRFREGRATVDATFPIVTTHAGRELIREILRV